MPQLIYQAKHQAYDIATGQLINLRLKEYDDKLIILDYWFNGCKPCIQSLNKLDSIAEVHGDSRWVVIPFTYQSFEQSQRTFDKHKWRFTSILADTILRQHFIGNGFRNIAWIKNGKVIATPPTSFATWENISKVLNGEEPSMPLRAEMHLMLDPNSPLFEDGNGTGNIKYENTAAKITGYSPDYRTESLSFSQTADGAVLYANNLTLEQLLYEAYKFDVETGVSKDDAFSWDLPIQLCKALLKPAPRMANAQNLSDLEQSINWKNNHLYGYARRFELGISEIEATRSMQKDLNEFLASEFNIEAKVEYEPYRYPVLRRLESKALALELLAGTPHESNASEDVSGDRPTPIFSDLLTNVSEAWKTSGVLNDRELEDDTGIELTQPVGYIALDRIQKDWTFGQINTELAQLGLIIDVVEREIPIVRIKEKI